MPGQITRRPYTDCPFTWTVAITGISSGSGTVGDRQCRGLNVSGYAMKFRACESTGNTLIWVGKCFVLPPPVLLCADDSRKLCDVSTIIDVPSFGGTATVRTNLPVVDPRDISNSKFVLSNIEITFPPTNIELPDDGNFSRFHTGRTTPPDAPGYYWSSQQRKIECVQIPANNEWWGSNYIQIGGIIIKGIANCPPRVGGSVAIDDYENDILTFKVLRKVSDSDTYVEAIYGRLDFQMWESFVNSYDRSRTCIVMSVFTTRGGAQYVYETTDSVFYFDDDAAECERTTTANLVGPGDLCFGDFTTEGFAPKSIQIITKIQDERNGLEGVVGADEGDRGNATWRLEYDIAQTLWTLHSFERIEYPIYTLVDADPCVGLEKILTRVEASGGNGCEVSPDTVTITRGCPDNLSNKPRDKRTRAQCPRTITRKGCDCQNVPIDERWRYLEKCANTTNPGCEDYGDDVKCFYPKNQLTCSFCGDKDIPCTYDALFGGGVIGKTGVCDIIYDDKDIAASTVTLRQRCRFQGPCNWVAVGPTDDARDGVVGHDPYCMLCAQVSVGTCASNCTWESVQAGVCPQGGKPSLLNPRINILEKWGISWSLNVAEPATLTYDHPSFGVLIYTTSMDEPFLCDNVNTLYLTAQGELPDGVMPESICVRPRYSGCGGAMDYDVKSDAYEEVEDQIACCDPACGSIGPIPITVRCCFSLERCETTFVAQTTLLGRDSPAGPSYLGSCTLHGVLWTGVIYCDGVRWKTDWYCKSPREFFITTTHTHTCCPLTLSVEYWPDNFGGVKCCPVQECKCCDTTGTDYDTLEMSITFPADCAQDRLPTACTFSRPVTMTLSMTRAGTYPNHVWTVDPILCDPDYGFDMSVSCLNGQWSLLYNFGGGIPAAICNPNSGTLTATNSALCPAILLEWTNPIVCDNACVLVSNITITS